MPNLSRVYEELLELEYGEDFQATRDLFWSQFDVSQEGDVEQLVALYDAEIREIDAEIGKLIMALSSLEQEIIVVLTSDHGEEFMEHGRKTHSQLYREVVRVPLIIHHPRVPGMRRVSQPVSHVSLAPTILELVELPPLVQSQGRSFAETVVDGHEVPEQVVFSEKMLSAAGEPSDSLRPCDTCSLQVAGRKVILNKDGELESYDLGADPRETRDLRGQGAMDLLPALESLGAGNRGLSVRLHADGAPAATEPLDEETVRHLKALGYLSESGDDSDVGSKDEE
jgi:arylsulfatase A-like enzyme